MSAFSSLLAERVKKSRIKLWSSFRGRLSSVQYRSSLSSLDRCCLKNRSCDTHHVRQRIKIIKVSGSARAQYSQNRSGVSGSLSPSYSSSFHFSNMAMPRRLAIKSPGRNRAVITASALREEESRVEVTAMRAVKILSSCCILA